MTTELALHELLSAAGGTKLLMAQLLHELPTNFLQQTPDLAPVLNKILPITIFSHGTDHFPDFVSASQPILTDPQVVARLPETCSSQSDNEEWQSFSLYKPEYQQAAELRVLLGNCYPVCLNAHQLPHFTESHNTPGARLVFNAAQVLSGVDKLVGTTFTSFEKYFLLTPDTALLTADSLLLYVVKNTLASFQQCIEAPDVESVLDAHPQERILAQLKVALLVGAVYLASTPLTDAQFFEKRSETQLQPNYALRQVLIGSSFDPRLVAQQLHADRRIQAQWQEAVDFGSQQSFYESIQKLVKGLLVHTQEQFTQAVTQAQEVYALLLNFKKKHFKNNRPPVVFSSTQTAELNQIKQGFIELLHQIDDLNPLDLQEVANPESEHGDYQDLLQQTTKALRSMTGVATQDTAFPL